MREEGEEERSVRRGELFFVSVSFSSFSSFTSSFTSSFSFTSFTHSWRRNTACRRNTNILSNSFSSANRYASAKAPFASSTYTSEKKRALTRRQCWSVATSSRHSEKVSEDDASCFLW